MTRLHLVRNVGTFPVISADRSSLHDDIGRVVIDGAASLEPHYPDTDEFVTLPIAISHNAAAGVVLEVGPFDLDHTQVQLLQNAIDQWRRAGGGPV